MLFPITKPHDCIESSQMARIRNKQKEVQVKTGRRKKIKLKLIENLCQVLIIIIKEHIGQKRV